MRIKTITDLVDWTGATRASATSMSRRMFKDTACGASVSVQTDKGWFHNGNDTDLSAHTLVAFTIQTIVEGSDATVDSDPFKAGVSTGELDKWIKYMEEEAEHLWKEANEDADNETADAQ